MGMGQVIKGKYVIQVTVDGKTMWFNGARPFVEDIDKAFICTDLRSAEKNAKRIIDFYGFTYKIVALSINTV